MQQHLAASLPLARISLLFVLLLLNCGLAQAVTAGEDSRYSDYIVPGFEDWDQQREQWDQAHIDSLAQSETPWISLSGRFWNLRRQFRPARQLTRDEFSERDQMVSELFSEVKDDLYSLVILAGICQTSDYTEKCLKHDIYKRIIRLDSENIMAYMIAITANWRQYSGNGNTLTDKVDNPEIRQFVKDAAKATVWAAYDDRLTLPYYRENLKFVLENPPPTEAQRSVPDYVLAFMLAYPIQMTVHPLGRMDVFSALCRHYREIGHEELTRACSRLIVLLRENKQSQGYHMESYQAQLEDPFGPNSLYLRRKAMVFARVRKCMATQWIDKKSQWPGLSRNTIENYVTDISEYGQWEATRNASIAEYNAHPSHYAENPGNCEAMLDLSSSEMADLLDDDDPLEGVLEHRARLRLIEDYAAHTSDDERMMIEIDKLDTIESVSDPLVQHLGSHGEPAVPYLLEKVCSSRRMTALAAAYALSSEPTDSTLYILLEALAESRVTWQSCEVVAAITSVMGRMKDQYWDASRQGFNTDFDALLDAVFCELDRPTTPDLSLPERTPIIVFSSQVREARTVECEARPLEARPGLDRFEFREWIETKAFHGLKVEILDLPESDKPTPIFENQFGARPVALAKVFESRRGGGDGSLWVKAGNDWIKLQKTHSIVH